MIGSTFGSPLTAMLCLRCCFDVEAARRAGFLADRIARGFFVPARLGFVF
jgi:hypothetical protein